MPRDGLRPLAQLALLLLPAVTLGVTVENELCPAGAAETKLCSARQDFVLVVDVSYSRQPYFEEFKAFLLAFLDQIGLDGTEDGPRVSVVSFHGSVHANPDEFWTDEESTTYLDLSNSRSEVKNFVRNMDDPNAACTETGGCTCISCGANVAWARIPVDSRNGAAQPAFRSPPPPPATLHALTASSLHQRPRLFMSTLPPLVGRGGQPPTLIFLTDGEQNTNGGPSAAFSAMANIKAEGARVLMVGYGEGNSRDNMNQMASEPSSTCASGLDSGLGASLSGVATVRPADPISTLSCAYVA